MVFAHKLFIRRKRRGPIARAVRVGGLAALSLLSACSGQSGFKDLEEYVTRVKSGPPGRMEPVPDFKAYETYAYSVFGARDPFEPLREEAPVTAKASTSTLVPNARRNREALEKFPLDTLHFAGHLQQGDKQWAIVTSPDGLVHRVQEGNYLGQNFGKIVAVSETQLQIVEVVSDATGGWVERPAALSLNQE